MKMRHFSWARELVFVISVYLVTYLWRGPALGQAQLKVVLHGGE